MFVATKVILAAAPASDRIHGRKRLRHVFVATKVILAAAPASDRIHGRKRLRHVFVATKVILAAAPASDRIHGRKRLRQNCSLFSSLLHRRKTKELLADLDSQQRAPRLLQPGYHTEAKYM